MQIKRELEEILARIGTEDRERVQRIAFILQRQGAEIPGHFTYSPWGVRSSDLDQVLDQIEESRTFASVRKRKGGA